MTRKPVVFSGILKLFVILLSLVSVETVYACSVCFTEDGYLARYAYYGTTAGLILLPASLVLGFVYWIRTKETTTDADSSDI